jgi:hypothetical protein
MADESWEQIFTKPPVECRPAAASLTIPRVLGSPTCEQHCGGDHRIDAEIRCPRCRGVAARLIRHSWAHDAGHYFTTTVPMNGYRLGDPNRCRDCDVDFEREELR